MKPFFFPVFGYIVGMYVYRVFPLFCLIGYFLIHTVWFPSSVKAQSRGGQEGWPLIIGTKEGLYGLTWGGTPALLWTGGEVHKIKRCADYWALLTSQGIMVSQDLIEWEARNQGLPVRTIKDYGGGKKSFIPMVQEIKDLKIHPENPEIMVCALKDRVYISRNTGRTWESLGMPPYRTNGIKAVAVANLPDLTVFLSHSVYGIHYIHPNKRGSQWTELNTGLEKLETTNNPDEVSDIAAAFLPSRDGGNNRSLPVIYASQTFRRRIYRLDWEQKRFHIIWSDTDTFGTVDSLDPGRETLRFVQEGMVVELNPPSPGEAPRVLQRRSDILDFIMGIPETLGLTPSCLFLGERAFSPDSEGINLSELWLLDTSEPLSASLAWAREGFYLPINHAMVPASLKPYLDMIDQRGLNMVVIDMKDDYGRLRFDPHNRAIAAKGRVFRPLDIDGFLKSMKERGIYTVARVVVFKDPELAQREQGKFAIWDSRQNKPWVGYRELQRKKQPPAEGEKNPLVEILPAKDPAYEIVRTYYDENWVDPYSEEVWDYIALLSLELHTRGFDEIQFDYIRFPTDGINLSDARYRWQHPGMDMDSAIISFLRHIRSRLNAPISVDIYGANGWYRTGARTGQEVELLVPYVDVICPMYYPSHFEQTFLAQAPPELRPYRIYHQGIQRAERISRGRVIIRPYIQAFYLNVSYDRKYYNPEYVRLEVKGVRDVGKGGLTYWNNSGRYGDIPLK